VWENVDLNWIWGSVDSFVNDPDDLDELVTSATTFREAKLPS
jgi:hypothetical protein